MPTSSGYSSFFSSRPSASGVGASTAAQSGSLLSGDVAADPLGKIQNLTISAAKTGIFKKYVSAGQVTVRDWWSRISSNYSAAHLSGSATDAGQSIASTALEPSQVWGYREHLANLGSTAMDVIKDHQYFACATAVVGTLIAANYARKWWVNRQQQSKAGTGATDSASHQQPSASSVGGQTAASRVGPSGGNQPFW